MLTSFTVSPVTQTADVAVNIPSSKFVFCPFSVAIGKESKKPPINIIIINDANIIIYGDISFCFFNIRIA